MFELNIDYRENKYWHLINVDYVEKSPAFPKRTIGTLGKRQALQHYEFNGV